LEALDEEEEEEKKRGRMGQLISVGSHGCQAKIDDAKRIMIIN
jgi:hypothetical protein